VDAGLTVLEPAGPAARLPSYHERVLRLGEVVVEVHHSFVQRVRHRIDYEAVWARRAPVAWPGARVFRLDDADALAYHALSLAIDEFSVPLVRYVDLWLLLEAAPGVLEAAAERARSWRTVRAVYGALRQLFRLLPELRTQDRVAVASALLAAPTRRFLDSLVLPRIEDHGRGKNMSRAVELWRKLWLLDNPWRRIRFGLYQARAVLVGCWSAWRRRAGRAGRD
jgi:hypothetical protein